MRWISSSRDYLDQVFLLSLFLSLIDSFLILGISIAFFMFQFRSIFSWIYSFNSSQSELLFICSLHSVRFTFNASMRSKAPPNINSVSLMLSDLRDLFCFRTYAILDIPSSLKEFFEMSRCRSFDLCLKKFEIIWMCWPSRWFSAIFKECSSGSVFTESNNHSKASSPSQQLERFKVFSLDLNSFLSKLKAPFFILFPEAFNYSRVGMNQTMLTRTHRDYSSKLHDSSDNLCKDLLDDFASPASISYTPFNSIGLWFRINTFRTP